jgi:hypothetical protein
MALLPKLLAAATLFMASTAQAEVFNHPLYGDTRLDLCVYWNDHCGWDAAHAFCLWKGYSTVVDWQIDRHVGHTRLIGSNEICHRSDCDSFSRIECR